MMVKKPLRAVLPVIIFAILMVFFISQSADTSSQPLSPDDINSDESFPKSASFTMTKEEFSEQQAALELRIAVAYDKLSSTLTKDQRLYLQEAQTAWRNYYENFAAVLKVQLDAPVTVFYENEGEERKTNIYRDTVLIMLDERATDLESWAEHNYWLVEASEVAELKKQIRAEKSVLADTISMNIIYLNEGFREAWQKAYNSWYSFLASNTIFISAATRSNGAVMAAEELFQLERMNNLTLLHQKGILHLRQEKEE
jgi:uncharacterized protein YecT (DUF1311 family)